MLVVAEEDHTHKSWKDNSKEWTGDVDVVVAAHRLQSQRRHLSESFSGPRRSRELVC